MVLCHVGVEGTLSHCAGTWDDLALKVELPGQRGLGDLKKYREQGRCAGQWPTSSKMGSQQGWAVNGSWGLRDLISPGASPRKTHRVVRGRGPWMIQGSEQARAWRERAGHVGINPHSSLILTSANPLFLMPQRCDWLISCKSIL